MNGDWQDVVALAVVLAAALYLTRGLLPFRRGKAAAGCASGCASCPLSRGDAATAPAPVPIQISLPRAGVTSPRPGTPGGESG